jgi:hypothetical protein
MPRLGAVKRLHGKTRKVVGFECAKRLPIPQQIRELRWGKCCRELLHNVRALDFFGRLSAIGKARVPAVNKSHKPRGASGIASSDFNPGRILQHGPVPEAIIARDISHWSSTMLNRTAVGQARPWREKGCCAERIFFNTWRKSKYSDGKSQESGL